MSRRPIKKQRPSRNKPRQLGRSQRFIVVDQRLFSSASIIALFCGIILFVVGAALDLGIERYPALNALLAQCFDSSGAASSPATQIDACQDAVMQYDVSAHGATSFDWLQLMAEALKTTGLAIMASVTVAAVIENRIRRRFFEQMSQRIRDLASNVMVGMFDRNHPERLIQIIKDELLDRDCIRSELSVNYTFHLWPSVEDIEELSRLGIDYEKRLKDRSFIKVDVLLNTTVRNVSTVRGQAGVATLPLRLGLQNPMINELKPGLKLKSYLAADHEFSQEEIKSQNERIQEQLKDDNNIDIVVDLGNCKIPYGGTAKISASYAMIKELEDTEVFRSNQIAETLNLTVHDATGLDLRVRARSIGYGRLKQQGAGSGTLQWQLSEIALPQQGLMIWWKKPFPTIIPDVDM